MANNQTESKVAYNNELGPMIEVPIKLRIPKNLYEFWEDIASNYPGWYQYEQLKGFANDCNITILRMYMQYITESTIVLEEGIGRLTVEKLKKKHNIDSEFLLKVESNLDYVDAMILQGKESNR
jgi:hypothetical protein